MKSTVTIFSVLLNVLMCLKSENFIGGCIKNIAAYLKNICCIYSVGDLLHSWMKVLKFQHISAYGIYVSCDKIQTEFLLVKDSSSHSQL